MSRIRVIAHFMHESEESAARQVANWSDMKSTASFLVGEIDEEDVANLEQQGIIVQRVVPEPSAEGARVKMLGKPRFRGVAPAFTKSINVSAGSGDAEAGYFQIQTSGPLLDAWKQDLANLGARMIELLPDGTPVVHLPAGAAAGVAKLPWVQGIRRDEGTQVAPAALEIAQARSGPPAGGAMVTYDVIVREEPVLPTVEQWIAAKGIHIVGKSRRKIRIMLAEDSAWIDDLRALPEVEDLEPWLPPRLHNDRARVLMTLDDSSAHPAPPTEFPLKGKGQLIAVADTGIDDTHPDFQGRIKDRIAFGRPGPPALTDDPHGHGTHVAGSVLGDGAASGGAYKGAAPEAELYFQALLDPTNGLGLPVDLNHLFQPAYDAGARVHNNSWGAVAQGSYRSTSREVDEFVSDHPDMVIVFSAGNDGKAANPPLPDRRTAQPGFVNWRSVGAPASAKNCITVGASRSDRTAGGYSTLTYGTAWGSDFPNPPISLENVSGNPQCIAGFSSRGPTADYRIKPDLVAPGTDILSCLSSIASLGNFFGPMLNGGTGYAFNGGTSMAAPLVAGCAALVREYYLKERQHEPSAALVKATLINGTKWLSGPDATADHPAQPNLHQGFGAVDMANTIPVAGLPGAPAGMPQFELHYFDTWKSAGRQLVQTGMHHRYEFFLTAPGNLRICMAYTDVPGPGLQNNLNLFLHQTAFSTTKWNGNSQFPFSLGGPDTANNVEVIRLDNAQPGQYRIQITAQNFPGENPSQDYALVISSTAPVSNLKAL